MGCSLRTSFKKEHNALPTENKRTENCEVLCPLFLTNVTFVDMRLAAILYILISFNISLQCYE